VKRNFWWIILYWNLIIFIFTSCWQKLPPEVKNYLQQNNIKKSDFLKLSYTEICQKDKQTAYYVLKTKLSCKQVNFFIYEIKMGENFWGIAKKYGIDIDTVIGANPDLNSLIAYTGQTLIILNQKGIIHEIRENEKIDDIESLYGKDYKEIKKFNPDMCIKKGNLLFIPDVKPKVLNPSMNALYEKRNIFRSPICGNGYTSLVGMREHPILKGVTKFHNGVDIRAKTGTWVGAAAEGTVIYAGWINGYGKTIKIKHENGYVTMYAHLSEIHVKNGQKIKSGQLIGKSGNTGHSTGPHLHFSIFKNGKVENPLDYIW